MNQHNVDHMVTPTLLSEQVYFSPYLFEAFLLEPVDDVRSTAKVGNGVVVISLSKRISRVWERLMITTSKSIKSEIMLQSINTAT